MLHTRYVLFSLILLFVFFTSRGAAQETVSNGLFAFSTTDGIYVANPDGTNSIRIADNAYSPRWSPDGTQIVFSSNRDGNAEIYVMNADGTDQRRLTSNDAADYPLDWSPDGAKLSFASERDGHRQIYVMNADGSGQFNLTNTDTDEFGGTRWSSDSTQLLNVISFRDGYRQIYICDVDGSGCQNLVDTAGVDIFFADVSSTGQGYLVTIGTPSYSHLYLIDEDGSDIRPLTDSEGAYDALWSPDGSKIILSVSFDNDGSPRDYYVEFYTMDTDGTNQRLVARLEQVSGPISPNREVNPVGLSGLSPDGKKFVSFVDMWRKDDSKNCDCWHGLPTYLQIDIDTGTFIDFSAMEDSDWQVLREGQSLPIMSVTPTGIAVIPTAQPTIESTVVVFDCTVNAANTVNLRAGAGTNFELVGQLASGTSVRAVGQSELVSGFVWYHLESGEWVREDLVTTSVDCDLLPVE